MDNIPINLCNKKLREDPDWQTTVWYCMIGFTLGIVLSLIFPLKN